MISRRQVLYFSALLAFWGPFVRFKSFAANDDRNKYAELYPFTLTSLKDAYRSEMMANRHYLSYCQKALSENYPNIAYLFSSLAVSEKIHADSYLELILSLGSSLESTDFPVSISTTKTNLNTAAIKELDKINEFYPEIFKKLSTESHDQAIIDCMYSWKSHQQHEMMINKIKKYSGFFFGSLARKIESMDPNYYVCEICGSTIDENPITPCEICNYPSSHYTKLDRPILSVN